MSTNFVCLGCNVLEHIGLGMVIATEAAWMLEKLHAEQWQIGKFCNFFTSLWI